MSSSSSPMATPNGGSISDTKADVFKEIQRIRRVLRERIEKLKMTTKKKKKKKPTEVDLTKEQVVEMEELRSHFSGLRHELQLVADLLPLYKIVKEEDEETGDSEEDAETKRKKEEEEKWGKVKTWIGNVGEAIDNILLQQQEDDKETGDSEEDAEAKRKEEQEDKSTKTKTEQLGLSKMQQQEDKSTKIKTASDKIKTKLLEVSKMVAAMKEKIQLSHRKKPGKLATEKDSTGVGMIELALLGKDNYKVFTEFQNKYQRLDKTTKLCFLCLAFFPEGVVIKKRLLVYWWIGEGLIDCTGKEKTMEDVADEVIDRLVDDGFLHIVDKMSGLEIDSYRMHPLVRSALVAQAKRVKFFDFEDGGMPTARVDSRSCKACLVDDSFIRQDRRPEYLLTYLAEGEEEPKDAKKLQVDEKLRQLQAFFNHNRRLVDLKSNLFSKMKNLNILHLGRWQNASRHHIEVETTDFLEGLKYMKHLKYISLQGVSQIRELPELVCKLQFLQVLDLRACHNLQELPKDIGNVKLLTHLDISECYLLDGLPKSVSKLIQLQVMKGFVIGDQNNNNHCTLQELNGFKNLRKLTIHTSNDKFPGDVELKAFKNFVKLEKLSIAWGRGTLSAKPDEDKKGEVTATKTREDSNTEVAEKNKKDAYSANLEGSKKGTGWKKSRNERRKEEKDPATSDDTKNKMEGEKQSQEEVPKDAAKPTKANKEGSTRGGVKEKQKVTNGAKKEGSSVGTDDKESGGKKETDPENPRLVEFPERLEKLDLQCFPHAECPKWLNPQNLKKLEKLYIRGGEMKTLGEMQHQKWQNVQILLLKYLSGFMLTWDQLKAAFPKLIYLEKVNCPRLTFYPCNERGEWKTDESFDHATGADPNC